MIETQRLTRTQFERWFANRDVRLVIMESCGWAHHWARWLTGLGIEVKLLPAQYLRADVRRNKTDAADATALLEAARASDIRPVRVKSIDTGDADSMSARATPELTEDAGYTTAGASPKPKPSVSFLPLTGSPYMTC